MNLPGMRAVPSLRYLQTLPRFEEHHFDDAVDESVDQGPTGGHGWDGRADTAHEQALLPLTSPFEMANSNMDEVVAKVQNGESAAAFRDAFGESIFDERAQAAAAILWTLEVFQQDPARFYPYTSRYDAWLRRRGELEPKEQHGLALFDDPKKGNCASCHPSQMRRGALPHFTDFGFAALGVPRNNELVANKDAKFFDLGLGGPLRTDFVARAEYAGMFRVPSLRNVATRRAFFHNGRFHTLREVVAFYLDRDAHPSRWYPRAVFDDSPRGARANLNREPPFGPRAKPALDSGEVDDLLAFLATLTDADAHVDAAPAR